jgi:hypothetical protein
MRAHLLSARELHQSLTEAERAPGEAPPG